MLGYFVRRLIGGMLTFFFAAFVMYTTILYTPSGPPDGINHGPRITEGHIQSLMNTFELDKPWPLNFLAYLFDPGENTEMVFGKAYPKGLQVSILGVEIEGSGLITGDLGRSIMIARGEPVMSMYGPGLDLVFAFLVSLIVTFTYVVVVQRIGRPTSYIAHRQFGTLPYKSHLLLDPIGSVLHGRLSRI